MKSATGFTLVELIITLVLISVLAVVVMPRMSGSDFRATEFKDQVVATLRYAQKTATSHRRLVCVTFPDTASISLAIALVNPANTCPSALIPPGSTTATIASKDSSYAVFNPLPGALFFQPDGRGTSDGAGAITVSPTLTIAGQTITIVGATGYVQ